MSGIQIFSRRPQDVARSIGDSDEDHGFKVTFESLEWEATQRGRYECTSAFKALPGVEIHNSSRSSETTASWERAAQILSAQLQVVLRLESSQRSRENRAAATAIPGNLRPSVHILQTVYKWFKSFTQKLCTYAWDFNLKPNPSWFCAAHGLALGSIATPVISDFGFPKAVPLHRGSPLVYAGQHAAEIMRAIRKW
ncbi:hypothetical protein B0H19DRAFT_1082794 [Mycena capillaripes]|nr:hypothetical protein B0H19DRAFT_1082794 [Mycena capillaripes]